MHAVLRRLSERSPGARARISSDLGEEWSHSTRSVLNLRNPFAHGKLGADTNHLYELSGDWGKIVFDLLEALPVYAALYNRVEREENSK